MSGETGNLAVEKPAATELADREPPGRALWRGLTEPSVLSVVTAICTATTICLGGTFWIHDQWVVRHGDKMAGGDDGLHVRATQRALELKHHGESPPAVILIGDLGTASPLEVQEAASRMPSAGNEDLPLYDLRSRQQTLWETMALADQVPRRNQGVVAIMVTAAAWHTPVKRLIAVDQSSRLGLCSPWVAIERDQAGLEYKPIRARYFLDNHRFLLQRLSATARTKVGLSATDWNADSMAAEEAPPAEDGSASSSTPAGDVSASTVNTLVERLIARSRIRILLVFEAGLSVPKEIRTRVLAQDDRQKVALLENVDLNEENGGIPIQVWQMCSELIQPPAENLLE